MLAEVYNCYTDAHYATAQNAAFFILNVSWALSGSDSDGGEVSTRDGLSVTQVNTCVHVLTHVSHTRVSAVVV